MYRMFVIDENATMAENLGFNEVDKDLIFGVIKRDWKNKIRLEILKFLLYQILLQLYSNPNTLKAQEKLHKFSILMDCLLLPLWHVKFITRLHDDFNYTRILSEMFHDLNFRVFQQWSRWCYHGTVTSQRVHDN